MLCTKWILSVIILSSTTLLAQDQCKLAILKAKNVMASYRIGNDWFDNKWVIIPQIKEDTLQIPCYLPVEDFAFYTDKDSIQFDLQPNKSFGFSIQLNDTTYAQTIIIGVNPPITKLQYDTLSTPSFPIKYEQDLNNGYLSTLRTKFAINQVIKNATNDTERALKIMHWVHLQWKHDGYHAASHKDAISILDEARRGNNFRCVEYGIVTAACLSSIGLKARVLGLKRQDIETSISGGGHVVAEVYLNDLKRWVMLDSQWDAMPVLNNLPLNAVEFQQAITQHYLPLEIRSISATSKRVYASWIYHYLFYFDCALDNRSTINSTCNTIDGKHSLMLVPVGAKSPTIFQVNRSLNYCLYTHSQQTFYAPPTDY